MKEIKAIIEETDNNFNASLPILDGCVASGKTLQELKKNLKEALQLHIEGMKEDGDQVPTDFEGEFRIILQY